MSIRDATKPGSRALAARVIDRVISGGRALDRAESEVMIDVGDASLKPAVRALSFGTLRFAHRLGVILDQLLHRPLARRESVVRALALVGLYDLIYGDTPEHAALHQAGEAARQLERPWAVKLINALLRGFQRREGELLDKADRQPAGRWSHPQWMLERFRADWPQAWEDICAANNRHPPFWLRVNLARTTREACLDRLRDGGMDATAPDFRPSALLCASPVAVDGLPGFREGQVSVQDAAAQCVVDWLDLAPGQRVLDACAAPGGKTAHMLEHCPGARVTALDVSPSRMQRVAENLERTGTTADLRVADARDLDAWWDGEPFQRILVDAPCSGSGVIRRHPDIKFLRRPTDLATLAETQLALLNTLWPLLADGGRMVYTTCSVMTRENQQVADAFSAAHAAARVIAVPPMPGCPAGTGWQVLPGVESMDGFFYCAWERHPA